MRDVLRFVIGKIDQTNLKFHYLRTGRASPLLDTLRELTQEQEIEWVQHEANDLYDYHFGSSYEEYDAAVLNLDVNEDNIVEVRRAFWESFIWQTEDKPQLLVIVIPDTSDYGTLSKGQIIEALSLIRLTDRSFELFESQDDEVARLVDWLTSHAGVIHRKLRKPDEEKEESK